MLALQTIDPIFANNPSYLIDPENPDPTSTLVEDIIQASSVKRKRDTVDSGITSTKNSFTENIGSGVKRNILTENVGSGDDYTVQYSSADKDVEKGKNKNKAEEENDWIVGNTDILKSKEVNPNKSKTSSKNGNKKAKKLKNGVTEKVISSKDHFKESEGTGNKKTHQNQKSFNTSEDENDWISGSADVITEYLKKKKELELSLKKKDDLLTTNSGSGSDDGSGSGSGEFQYTVKPYTTPTEEKGHPNHDDQENSKMTTHLSENFQNDLPMKINQTLLKDWIHQQEEVQHHHKQQMETYKQPETLKELVAPLQTTNISKNESSDLMNHLADKVVENPNLRNDYLFQLTHQEPLGLVGSHNEVESVAGVGGASSSVTGSVRGQIQGEDDTEVTRINL